MNSRKTSTEKTPISTVDLNLFAVNVSVFYPTPKLGIEPRPKINSHAGENVEQFYANNAFDLPRVVRLLGNDRTIEIYDDGVRLHCFFDPAIEDKIISETIPLLAFFEPGLDRLDFREEVVISPPNNNTETVTALQGIGLADITDELPESPMRRQITWLCDGHYVEIDFDCIRRNIVVRSVTPLVFVHHRLVDEASLL